MSFEQASDYLSTKNLDKTKEAIDKGIKRFSFEETVMSPTDHSPFESAI